MIVKKYYYIILFLFTYLSWSQNNVPPTINAVGNQAYCPLSEVNIVTSFDIIDPDDSTIKALYIQISEGYVNGEDELKLNNSTSHPNIVSSWSMLEGKLTLNGANGLDVNYTDLIAAVKDVVFTNNSVNVSGNRSFSFTIGSANYLPSTDHYYEYVSDIGITWTDAKVAAENRTYLGLQGYLVTITSADEAKLAGEQAKGTGWIGGSDAETEGNWKWETGPEKGTFFWFGLAVGNSPTFAFWNTNEPNDLNGEDYAHITDPNIGIPGSWNDLSNTGAAEGDFQPKGYIVEYGGMPGDPVVNISASTEMYIPTINATFPATRCGPGQISLKATSAIGDVVWHNSPTGGSILFTGEIFNPNITNTTTFYASVVGAGCEESPRIPVIATAKELPDILPMLNFKNCDVDEVADGYTIFNLNEATEIITKGNDELRVSYHLSVADAESNINSINPFPFENQTSTTVYARVEKPNACFLISTVNLEVSTTSFTNGYSYNLVGCDNLDANDGIAVFDLTEASNQLINQFPTGQNLKVAYFKNLVDAQLEENEIIDQANYINENPYTETLFVRVESANNGACYGISPSLVLKVNPSPEFEIETNAAFCLNIGILTLETFNPKDDYSYEWKNENDETISTDPTATVTSKGIYTVTATSTLGCTSTPKTITVKESDLANITLNDILIKDDSENNSITINTENLGIGDYEFALDDADGAYQTEPLFENVSAGIHTIYIREQNNCGTTSIDVSVIGFPKFFTPNNDGFNDTWQIKGINEDSFQMSTIYIYDRFGKMLAKTNVNDKGWDGTYKGNPMPASDYWFKVQLTDKNGNVRNRKGHFSLVRR
ncbi:T9SS type B sorting domain-containing protein [Aureibaculum sp. 2210JD6-5]|uniref:T9SS type B sorting domain-containing protein n=1 Tax=Aureibaculum sp. 2210JD6-5 TaxID=3103957 RepID=UPI002AAEA96E|nr:T9SS type B sorting domain-containing protein [Aureibaculum sp. 2210JD6-5]MDY7394753.1 T9SS type B sorting domain-containing protein [Aureibaculum sp. 2210JD6-5]